MDTVSFSLAVSSSLRPSLLCGYKTLVSTSLLICLSCFSSLCVFVSSHAIHSVCPCLCPNFTVLIRITDILDRAHPHSLILTFLNLQKPYFQTMLQIQILRIKASIYLYLGDKGHNSTYNLY